MTEKAPRFAPRRAAFVSGGLALVVFAAVLYGKKADTGKEAAAACAESAAAASRVAGWERGEVAAAVSPKSSGKVPDLDFNGPDGAPRSLAAFRGKIVLLNLWATWCVPCREEMPALDRMQAALGSKDFEVVAVNIDTTRLERVHDFLRDAKIFSLASYSDPQADTFYRLKTAGKALGLPTTILVGRDGCEIATMAGPANWASEDAKALVRAALQQ